MAVDREVAFGSERFAHSSGALDDLVHPPRPVDWEQLRARIHLDGGEALCRLGRRLGGNLLRGAIAGTLGSDPGVDANLFADRATQEFVDRDSARLSGYVPERLVDAGDGARENGAAVVVAYRGQGLPDPLDCERILTHELVPKFADGRFHRADARLGSGLAPADDALVSLNA